MFTDFNAFVLACIFGKHTSAQKHTWPDFWEVLYPMSMSAGRRREITITEGPALSLIKEPDRNLKTPTTVQFRAN